jgi:hypothetical protein
MMFEKLRYSAKLSELQNQIKQDACSPEKETLIIADRVSFIVGVNVVERRTRQFMYV